MRENPNVGMRVNGGIYAFMPRNGPFGRCPLISSFCTHNINSCCIVSWRPICQHENHFLYALLNKMWTFLCSVSSLTGQHYYHNNSLWTPPPPPKKKKLLTARSNLYTSNNPVSVYERILLVIILYTYVRVFCFVGYR